MADHKTGTRKEWLAARLELLKAEKELTRRGDDGCFETYDVLRVVHPRHLPDGAQGSADPGSR